MVKDRACAASGSGSGAGSGWVHKAQARASTIRQDGQDGRAQAARFKVDGLMGRHWRDGVDCA
jgi:hypothetical protein